MMEKCIFKKNHTSKTKDQSSAILISLTELESFFCNNQEMIEKGLLWLQPSNFFFGYTTLIL